MHISNLGKTTSARLPDGYQMRPTTMDDLEAVVNVFNTASMHIIGTPAVDKSMIRAEWLLPEFNLTSNTRVVTYRDGQVVGYMECGDEKPERIFLYGRVHPDHMGHGIGTYLMHWGHTRALEVMQKVAPGTRVVMQAMCWADHNPTTSLFTELGFAPIRYSHRMGIEIHEAPTVPVLPDIELRSYRHPEDIVSVVDTELDAFRDHWGFIERDRDEEVKELHHLVDNDDLFDPDNWLVAVDKHTNNIIGVTLNRVPAWYNPDAGMIMILAVRRSHRKRGIGRALLLASFKVMFEHGMKTIMLDVDANSLTGATRLYDSVGMRVVRTAALHEKELRPGKDMMVRNLPNES